MSHRRTWWVLVMGLALLAGCEKRSELTRVDSEKEANRILVVLEGRGIKSASKETVAVQRATAYSITVSPEELGTARAILVQNDLPREDPGGYAAMINSGGLIPTKQQERAKMMFAMAGELEKTLASIDRVVVARVHVVLPDTDPFQRSSTTKPAASAMVLIKYTPLAPVAAGPGKSTTKPAAAPIQDTSDAPVTEQQVQQMVARSVEGLTAQDVYVTFTKAMAMEPPPAPAVSPVVSGTVTGGGESKGPLGDSKNIQMQLFAAVAGFGLLSLILIALLVKEKRKGRLASSAEEAPQAA